MQNFHHLSMTVHVCFLRFDRRGQMYEMPVVSNISLRFININSDSFYRIIHIV